MTQRDRSDHPLSALDSERALGGRFDPTVWYLQSHGGASSDAYELTGARPRPSGERAACRPDGQCLVLGDRAWTTTLLRKDPCRHLRGKRVFSSDEHFRNQLAVLVKVDHNAGCRMAHPLRNGHLE